MLAKHFKPKISRERYKEKKKIHKEEGKEWLGKAK